MRQCLSKPECSPRKGSSALNAYRRSMDLKSKDFHQISIEIVPEYKQFGIIEKR